MKIPLIQKQIFDIDFFFALGLHFTVFAIIVLFLLVLFALFADSVCYRFSRRFMLWSRPKEHAFSYENIFARSFGT